MNNSIPASYTAFDGHDLLAQGVLEKVVLSVRQKLKSKPSAAILIFSDLTGKQMDFDLRGTEKEVLQRLQVYLSPAESASAGAGPGRPKLGVVAREVSLLPRHWEWLSAQSGGASATLRRLIEEARKVSSEKEVVTQAQERTYKFLSALAGDFPHYEEAIRALYAKDKKKFKEQIAKWPPAVKAHAVVLAQGIF